MISRNIYTKPVLIIDVICVMPYCLVFSTSIKEFYKRGSMPGNNEQEPKYSHKKGRIWTILTTIIAEAHDLFLACSSSVWL
jgi:hypothetical protein